MIWRNQEIKISKYLISCRINYWGLHSVQRYIIIYLFSISEIQTRSKWLKWRSVIRCVGDSQKDLICSIPQLVLYFSFLEFRRARVIRCYATNGHSLAFGASRQKISPRCLILSIFCTVPRYPIHAMLAKFKKSKNTSF